MSKTKEDLINFRMNKGAEAFELAGFSLSKSFWSSAASELYYTCFYYVQAVFAKYDIVASTHTGLISLFGLHFIKENKIDLKWGKLLRNLYDKRMKGDYGDFMVLTEKEIMPLVAEVEEFVSILKDIIKDRN